jgi:hypothetical protein
MRVSDAEVQTLMQDPKPLPRGLHQRIQVKPKRGHKERELDISGASGREYRLILRQSDINPLDFSIILAHKIPKTNQLFRLRRYNGKSHEHTNKLEGMTFYDFHIHMATERYQDSGFREDAFAEPTSRYGDFHAAVDCMLSDCRLIVPDDERGGLF